jgi:succinate dehydrogenase / fumarate reductase flavoprotein subunit
VLARVIAQGARNRDESRGAHFKPEFKNRDDANFLRTTMALYERGQGGKSVVKYVRELEYPLLGKTVRVTDEVDISLVKPRPRKYETAGAASHAVSDVPVKEPKEGSKTAMNPGTPG